MSMEYQRTQNGIGETFQWVDSVSAMVLDAVTGEPQRFGPAHHSIGTIRDAAEYVGRRPGWEGRLVIVKLETIRGFKLDRSAHEVSDV